MITKQQVEAIANEEIPKLCDAASVKADEYRVIVVRPSDMPRRWSVFWDVIEPNEDGLFWYRSTGIDISESGDVLRERIKREFADAPKLASMYSPQSVQIR